MPRKFSTVRRVDAEFWMEHTENGVKQGAKIRFIDATPAQVKAALRQIMRKHPDVKIDGIAQKILETGRLPCKAGTVHSPKGLGLYGGITKVVLAEVLQQVNDARPDNPRAEQTKTAAYRLGVTYEWIRALRKEWGL